MSPASPSDDRPLGRDEQLLWRALGRVAQRLPRVVDPEVLRSSGVAMTEFAVLDALNDAPERSLRVAELAAAIGLSASRAGRVVDTLVSRGWVAREKDAQDARATRVSLSDDGAERLAAALPHQARLARRHVLDHVPEDSREALRAALERIAGDGD